MSLDIHGKGPTFPPEGDHHPEPTNIEPPLDKVLPPISGQAPARNQEVVAAQVKSLIDKALKPEADKVDVYIASLAAPLAKNNPEAQALSNALFLTLHPKEE